MMELWLIATASRCHLYVAGFTYNGMDDAGLEGKMEDDMSISVHMDISCAGVCFGENEGGWI